MTRAAKLMLLGAFAVIALLFTVQMALAVSNENITHAYNTRSGTTSTCFIDAVNVTNLTGITGGVACLTTPSPGATNGSIDFPNNGQLTGPTINWSLNTSINVWVYPDAFATAGNDQDPVLATYNSGKGYAHSGYNEQLACGAGGKYYVVDTGGNILYCAASADTAGSWYMYTYIMDRTNNRFKLYRNGVNMTGWVTPTSWTGGTAAFYIGNLNGLTRYYDGKVALISVKEGGAVWSDSDVTDLYASGNGSLYPYSTTPSAPSTPTWVSPTPANGTTNNTQVTLNASSTSSGVRYYVWFDTNPNPTTLVVNNATTGNYTTSVPGTTTTYYYKAAVWNSTGGFSANTTVRVWTFDAVAPSITLNPSNEFSALNLSQRDPYDKSVHLNITFADDHDLYGMMVNITRGGTVYFNITNETLDGLTYNYTNTLNATTWPAGRYNVTLEVSDSHTAKEIKPYDVQKQAKGLRFQTAEGNDITIESTDGSDAIAEKKLDRYEFEFTFDDGKQKSRTFHVRSDKPIVYKANSAYKAHFVVSTGRGGNWIDFEGVTGTPSVTRINDFHYTVTFADVPAKARFKSIGGLNVLTVNYTFYVGNYSVLNPSPIYAREAGTFGLNVTTESTFTNTTAVLVYNGSTYTPEVTSSSSLYNFTTVATAPNATVNLTYNWTVTVFQQNGVNFTFNVSTVQVVRDWTIVSCGSPQFINWTQYDEDNPSTKLTGTFAVEIEYWVGNRSNAKLYNATFGSANSWALCFTPADGSFAANVYGQNTVPESFTHRFYVQNVTYSNSTTNYSIYNSNSTNDALYSDMKITTRYVTSYGYFKNVFAQLQRRYVGEGVWRTVQYDKSGDFGLLFFDIKEQSVDYRIKYYDENNSLLLETDSLKFVCTAAVCELTQLLDPASATTESPDIETVVTFNNATSVLTVEWDSASSLSSSVAIKVQKQNYNGLVTVCSTTQTGVAGSFDCNATGYTGELFVTVDVDGEQNAAEYVPIGRTSIASNMSKATQALVTFLLMLAIIAFGLFSPIALVIMTVLSLIVVFFLGTLSAITATFIIIAAVMGFVIAIKVKQ